jgi:hypothetical protein
MFDLNLSLELLSNKATIALLTENNFKVFGIREEFEGTSIKQLEVCMYGGG